MSNPIYAQTGYTPVTDYWDSVLDVVCNMTIECLTHDEKSVMAVAHKGLALHPPKEAVEWAEQNMALNHILWIVYDRPSTPELLLKTLNDLYYEQHDMAIDTLKGGALSEYLTIVD